MGTKGTLELLCGPSGVGKTSSLEGVTQSFRWTTREKREGEIDSRQAIFSGRSDGSFVTEEEFRAARENGKLVGVHRFPDPETGDLYGFPIDEMAAVLDCGVNISEQIAVYDPIEEIESEFSLRGNKVEKTLFLSSTSDLVRRLTARKNNDARRVEESIKSCETFLQNRRKFSSFVFNFPEVLSGENADRKVKEIIEKLERGEMPDELYDVVYASLENKLTVIEDDGDRIEAALEWYRKVQGTDTNLLRNHILKVPYITVEYNKVIFLYCNGTHLPRHLAGPFGISIVLRELGNMEGFDEVLEVENSIYNFLMGGAISKNYIDGSFLADLATPRILRRSLEKRKAEGILDLESLSYFYEACFDTYMAFKDYNHYIQIQRAQVERASAGERLTPRELAECMAYNLKIHQAFFEIDPEVNRSDHHNTIHEELRLSHIKHWENLRDNDLCPDYIGEETERYLHALAELTILESTSRISQHIGNILDYYQRMAIDFKRADKVDVDKVVIPIINAVNQLQIPRYNRFASLPLEEVAYYLRNIKRVCQEFDEKIPRDILDASFPTITNLHNFLAEIWIFNLREPEKILEEIRAYSK